MSELLEQIERFEQAAEQLDALVREAHSSAKALRQVMREAEQVRDSIAKAVAVGVDERIAETVRSGLAQYEAGLKAAIATADEGIKKRFDELTNLLLHGNAQGRGPSLVEDYGGVKRQVMKRRRER